MFIRCVFYYFVNAYEPELAYREMTENMTEGLQCKVSKSGICGQYANARDMLSRYMIYMTQNRKLGGPEREVIIDFMKFIVRGKKGKNDEIIILGFIEV